MTTSTEKTILAFDIGVKNLAFCILEGSTVRSLANVNLLSPVQPIVCQSPSCRHLAKYHAIEAIEAIEANYCKRHLPSSRTILPELLTKKPPSNKRMRELIKEHACPVQGTTLTNEACLSALATRFALPVVQPKQEAVARLSLAVIHDALRAFVEERWPIFSSCTHVLLENQPAFKNPHMKSVQVLLFATLREWFLRHGLHPSYHLVHAKKKVSAEKGDAGYADRKLKSEQRAEELFVTNAIQGPEAHLALKQAKKKSDMADALCMAVDHSEK